jgi:lipoprotein Spr
MKNIYIPKKFYKIPYNSHNFPNNDKQIDIKDGANCQFFVYTLLEYFGYPKLTFRSSELFDDKEETINVSNAEVFDIIMFNNVDKSYGAHLGLYIGKDKVIHLSKEVGLPSIWTFSNFNNTDKYCKIVGIKRVKKHAK